MASATVHSLLLELEAIASSASAEPWDNVGLMLGGISRQLTGVLVALDPTENVIDEARERGANVVITHHPLIFHPLKSISTEEPVGRLVQKALAADIAVISCHTNLDTVAGGVSDVLAQALGLDRSTIRPLQESEPGIGFGRVGRLARPLPGTDYLDHILTALSVPVVAVSGQVPAMVETVAVCGGSGSELAPAAHRAGAQLLVTGEIKHSMARWAEAAGLCLVDGGHYATERPVVKALAAMIERVSVEKGWSVPVGIALSEDTPFAFHFRPTGEK